MNLIIDASVWIADIRTDDVNHAESADFFDLIRSSDTQIHEPTLVLTECAGVLSRVTRNPRMGLAGMAIISAMPNLEFYGLSHERADHAGSIAATQHIRGADSVYVQLAAELDAVLITWDNELIARAPADVTTMTPADWLAANPLP